MKESAALILIGVAMLGAPALAQDFDLMPMANSNSDGKLTIEEYTAFSDQGWGFIGNGADKVKPADLPPMAAHAFDGVTPNADGYVTKDLYMAVIPGRFKAADKNNDGALDAAEFKASMGPPA